MTFYGASYIINAHGGCLNPGVVASIVQAVESTVTTVDKVKEILTRRYPGPDFEPDGFKRNDGRVAIPISIHMSELDRSATHWKNKIIPAIEAISCGDYTLIPSETDALTKMSAEDWKLMKPKRSTAYADGIASILTPTAAERQRNTEDTDEPFQGFIFHLSHPAPVKSLYLARKLVVSV